VGRDGKDGAEKERGGEDGEKKTKRLEGGLRLRKTDRDRKMDKKSLWENKLEGKRKGCPRLWCVYYGC